MSKLSQLYPNMMKQFNSLGYSYSYLESNFIDFINYCNKHYPNIENITKECALDWIYSKESKSKKVLNDRVLTIKHFSEYLNSIGIESYIPNVYIGQDFHKPISLLNDEQLKTFFNYSDQLSPCLRSPNREYVAPVLFRLIYACGLRNSEASNIKTKDINLYDGTIKIFHSKGDKDRTVYMDESLTVLCVRFNEKQTSLFPNREYFFTYSTTKDKYTKHNVDDLFDKILLESGLKNQFIIKPTVHGLRHLFAVNNMRECLKSKDNMDVHIKYLSQYMGHESVKETMYYLHMFENLLPVFKERINNLTKNIEVSYEEF